MFSDTELRSWLNFGIRDFSSKVHWYSRIVAKPVYWKVFEYDLPTDILKLELIRFQEKYRPRVLDEAEWSAATFLMNQSQLKSYPDFGFMYPVDKRLAIYPAPSLSRPASTLNGLIDASQTTIIVNDASTFPPAGYVIIENEQIRYQYIDGTTNLVNCRRGDGDTTAASHVNASVVEVAELQLFTRALPPDLSADGDIPKIPAQYVDALVLYCCYRAYLKRQMTDKANNFLTLYLARRKEAMEEREQATLDYGGGVKDEDLNTGFFGPAY